MHTRYRVEIDVATLRTKIADADLNEATRQYLDKSFDAMADKTMHENVWIDHEVFDASDLVSSATSSFRADREPAPAGG